MARKRHTAEEIVAKLRQVDVLTAQGRPVAEAVRAIGVTEVTYYRWRSEHGGLKGDQVRRLKGLEVENTRLRRAVSDLTLDKMILAEAARGNFRAPPVAAPAWSTWSPSSACPSGGRAGSWALGSGAAKRSTQRKTPTRPEDEAALTAAIIALATRYGRYGYRRITALLRAAGWVVNRKRVERSAAALPMAAGGAQGAIQTAQARPALARGRVLRAPPGGAPGPRLVLRLRRGPHPWPAAGGPSIRAAAEVGRPRRDGRKYRMLNVVDEFTRECLAIRVNRKLGSVDVVDVLSDLFMLRGIPGHVRSDNGPEFVAKAVREWIAAVGAGTAYIEPGSPLGDPPIAVPAGTDRQLRCRWENG